MKNVWIVITLTAVITTSAVGAYIAHRAAPRPGSPARLTRAATDTGTAPAPQPSPRPLARPPAEDPLMVYKVPLDDSPARGAKVALVTIVEASDFECPFCKRAAPTLRQIEAAYGSNVRFVFKENPLPIHLNAVPAAVIAEEALAQGGDTAFWAMHDELFALPALDRASLEKAAQALGLSPAGTKAALDRSKHLERIQRDRALLKALGAGGTPTFFVNGRKIVGAQPLEAFKAVIDEELQKARALVAKGVNPADVYARTTENGSTGLAAAAGRPPLPTQVATVPVRPDDPVRGPRIAPVTLVVFSDFQCPFCARLEPTLRQIQDAYGAKVRITWKHEPLPFHPSALPAARAAEAARVAGKFWEMHDKLFANQSALSEAAYAKYAKELRIDPSRFGRDAAAQRTARRIAEDEQLAAGVGATGTPTLFVNCRRLVGAQPLEAVRPVIDEELRKAEALRARGEKLDDRFYDRVCGANVSGPLAAVR